MEDDSDQMAVLKERLFTFTEGVIKEVARTPYEEDNQSEEARRMIRSKGILEYILGNIVYDPEFWKRKEGRACVNLLAGSDKFMVHDFPNEFLGVRVKRKEKAETYRHEFLIPFLRHYLDLFGEDFTWEKFNAAYEAFEQYVPGFPEEIQKYVVILPDFRLKGGERIETEDFIIRKPNFEEKHYLKKSGSDEYGRSELEEKDLSKLWVIELKKAKPPDVFIGDSDCGITLDDYITPDEMAEDVVLFLELITGSWIRASSVMSYGVMEKGARSFGGSIRRKSHFDASPSLSKKDETKISGKWDRFKKEEGARKGKYRIPLDRFSRSFIGKPDDQLLDLVIALEAFYRPDRSKKEGIAGGFLKQFGNNPVRVRQSKLLKSAYDIRNSLVHGDPIEWMSFDRIKEGPNIMAVVTETRSILTKILSKDLLQ